MKPWWLRLSGLLVLALTMPSVAGAERPSLPLWEEQLRWVEDADPHRQFETDIAAGRIRLFAIRGYTVYTPFPDGVRLRSCYPGAGIDIIEGTSDAIENPRHLQLIKAAMIFARTYNDLMRRHMESGDFRLCNYVD